MGPLEVPVEAFAEGAPARLVIRAYDLTFWRADGGVGRSSNDHAATLLSLDLRAA